LAHKRTLAHVRIMSALPPKADIGTQSRDVRFVPKADILRCSKELAIRSHFVGANRQSLEVWRGRTLASRNNCTFQGLQNLNRSSGNPDLNILSPDSDADWAKQPVEGREIRNNAVDAVLSIILAEVLACDRPNHRRCVVFFRKIN
jgi:hypothetical protein